MILRTKLPGLFLLSINISTFFRGVPIAWLLSSWTEGEIEVHLLASEIPCFFIVLWLQMRHFMYFRIQCYQKYGPNWRRTQVVNRKSVIHHILKSFRLSKKFEEFTTESILYCCNVHSYMYLFLKNHTFLEFRVNLETSVKSSFASLYIPWFNFLSHIFSSRKYS